MALRNFFKFRELPESETAKPFLEHLEDLRWTIVKMAIALLARDGPLLRLSRDRSCRSCSARLRDVGSADRRVARAWDHRFDHDLLSSRVLRRHRRCRFRSFFISSRNLSCPR